MSFSMLVGKRNVEKKLSYDRLVVFETKQSRILNRHLLIFCFLFSGGGLVVAPVGFFREYGTERRNTVS